jgi:hypothetical protein
MYDLCNDGGPRAPREMERLWEESLRRGKVKWAGRGLPGVALREAWAAQRYHLNRQDAKTPRV